MSKSEARYTGAGRIPLEDVPSIVDEGDFDIFGGSLRWWKQFNVSEVKRVVSNCY